jgi:hypothetical protein
MTDEQFLVQFTALTLAPAHFGHDGHVRLAAIHLREHGTEGAVRRTCAGIRAYATHLGVPGKFHWTVTEALVRLMAAAGGTLGGDARALLARHYSPALLDSAAARAGFVAPDRAPLPACLLAYRNAGLPLQTIGALLDGGDQAAAVRLDDIARDMAALRAQQTVLASLVTGALPLPAAMDKDSWSALFRAAGMDEAAMYNWHRLFEQNNPAAHEAFLRSLGLDSADVARIRAASAASAA